MADSLSLPSSINSNKPISVSRRASFLNAFSLDLSEINPPIVHNGFRGMGSPKNASVSARSRSSRDGNQLLQALSKLSWEEDPSRQGEVLSLEGSVGSQGTEKSESNFKNTARSKSARGTKKGHFVIRVPSTAPSRQEESDFGQIRNEATKSLLNSRLPINVIGKKNEPSSTLLNALLSSRTELPVTPSRSAPKIALIPLHPFALNRSTYHATISSSITPSDCFYFESTVVPHHVQVEPECFVLSSRRSVSSSVAASPVSFDTRAELARKYSSPKVMLQPKVAHFCL